MTDFCILFSNLSNTKCQYCQLCVLRKNSSNDQEFLIATGVFQVPQNSGGTYDFSVACYVGPPRNGLEQAEHRLFIVRIGEPRMQVCPGEGASSFYILNGKYHWCRISGVHLNHCKFSEIPVQVGNG